MSVAAMNRPKVAGHQRGEHSGPILRALFELIKSQEPFTSKELLEKLEGSSWKLGQTGNFLKTWASKGAIYSMGKTRGGKQGKEVNLWKGTYVSDAVRYQVMPPLASDEYQDLYEDIKVNGVLEPIHVDEDGVVIDGHHRSKIADELGIPCPVITHDDLDEAGKRSLAFTLNLKRRHLNREQRRALIAESLKTDPQLSNREHERRTGTHKNTVAAVREELEESGQIAHFEKRVDPRTGNASQPASQPPRPEPPSQVGPKEEIPATTNIGTDDPAELNQSEPEREGNARAKYNTHETEDGFIISGKKNQNRQVEAAERIATQLRASADALEIHFPERQFDTTFTRKHARKLAAELAATTRRIREHLSTLNEYGNGENHNA